MGTIGTDIELESCGVTTFETDLPQPLLLGFGDPLQRAGDSSPKLLPRVVVSVSTQGLDSARGLESVL